MAQRKIEIVNIDRFKPRLYADLFIPSWINGYSIAVEFAHNWFLSKFPQTYFKTVHIAGKSVFDDFRRFNFGDYAKREKPALLINGAIQYDFDTENTDIHQLGIDGYIKKTDYHRSFFKDPERKLYVGFVPEGMLVNFTTRCKFETRAQQLDAYKRMEIMFRIGCTETIDIDVDFHVPYELMHSLANDAGFKVNEGYICEPYQFLEYLNKYSQLPMLYKLRYINGKHEFFMRMNNIPLHLDTRNKLEADDGEVEGHTSNNFHIDMNFAIRVLVPKFYIYYSEMKTVNDVVITDSENAIGIYSVRVFDIPELNDRGWVQFGTSNYAKDGDEKYVKEIDITQLFKGPVDAKVGISLDDLIEDSVKLGISPDSFIEINLYTNDLAVNSGKIPIKMDWENRKILLPDNVLNNYFYIVVYTERGYINSKIIDINNVYSNRVTTSRKHEVDRSEDRFVE